MDPQSRKKQVLDWAFKDSFYWNLIDNLPKVTTDPRKLAYLRLPVKDTYEAILSGYRENKKRPESLHIVIELSENEIQNL